MATYRKLGRETSHRNLMLRNLVTDLLRNGRIETTVTRAKEKLILIGDPNCFVYGVNNDYIENRKTTLKELLENKYN